LWADKYKSEKKKTEGAFYAMEYLFAESIKHAVHLVTEALERGINAKYIAGGTDLAVQIADGVVEPHLLVDISNVRKLSGIDRVDGEIWIGAATSIAEIASSDKVPRCLVQGACGIGSPQIRNLGTVGGNICNASPCGDTLAPLLALDAELVLRSRDSDRSVPAINFFTGPKETVLKRGELLVQIVIKESFFEGISTFRMIGKRNGQAVSQVNTAVWLKQEPGSGEIVDIRIAFGSVAPVPLRLEKVEELFRGRVIDGTLMEEAKLLADREIRPISDVRASEEYRYIVAKSLLSDCIHEIVNDDLHR
jgi:xanthine dehydrogenase FAD-binding subunit